MSYLGGIRAKLATQILDNKIVGLHKNCQIWSMYCNALIAIIIIDYFTGKCDQKGPCLNQKLPIHYSHLETWREGWIVYTVDSRRAQEKEVGADNKPVYFQGLQMST